jgi:hypothetical protein
MGRFGLLAIEVVFLLGEADHIPPPLGIVHPAQLFPAAAADPGDDLRTLPADRTLRDAEFLGHLPLRHLPNHGPLVDMHIPRRRRPLLGRLLLPPDKGPNFVLPRGDVLFCQRYPRLGEGLGTLLCRRALRGSCGRRLGFPLEVIRRLRAKSRAGGFPGPFPQISGWADFLAGHLGQCDKRSSPWDTSLLKNLAFLGKNRQPALPRFS